MSGLLPSLANLLWYLSALPESRAFQRALDQVAPAQEALLLELLRRNQTSVFGRAHGFTAIRSVTEYQERVPLQEYDDLLGSIEQISAGEPGVLTAEPVQLLERTSGSVSASKLIPYTASLKAEFQRAVSTWIVDLFRSDPSLMNGQAYWSISPVTRRNERTAGGIPIGFEEDQEYLGGLQRHLSQSVMAVPSQVKLLSSMEAFRYVTLLFLLRSESLRLISVWNPTFLSLLLRPLAGWWESLATEIEQGGLSHLPAEVDEDLRAMLAALNQPDPRRAAAIRAAFTAGGGPGAIHARLWPRLRLVSCWTEAHAAPFVQELEQLLPQARVQGKGLIATEAFVSLPLVGQAGAVPALRSHFFEFLPGNGDRPRLAHELEAGQEYSVVVTTGGGLYRYRLHDRVAVAGHLRQAPLLRFLGKEANLSDRFGEKVNEGHVRDALARILPPTPAFAMVACEEWPDGWAYTLYLEAPNQPDAALVEAAAALEAALQENFHYRYCRDLGQLQPVRAFRIRHGAAEAYLATCQAHGQRLGDIKPVVLHKRSGWSDAFAGYPV